MANETQNDISTRRPNRSMDDYDNHDPFEYYRKLNENWDMYFISIGCVIAMSGGALANILAFVVLVIRRLWLNHEGYVYLAANFCANVGILLFSTRSFWYTSVYGSGYYYPPDKLTSNFMCKVWHFLMSIFFASGWLSVALLFNVYRRDHLMHRRRCGCPMIPAKCCTLFASKIIVGAIFSVLFICGIPYLVIYELHHGVSCHTTSSMVLEVAIRVEQILMWVLPFAILPIILLKMLCTKREGNIVGFSQIEERSVSDEQMRVMAVSLSSMTILLQIPVVLDNFYIVYFEFYSKILAHLVYGLSLGLQPILCFVILKALRDGFRSLLRNIRCCRGLFPSLDRNEEVVQLSAIQEDQTKTAET